MPLYSISTSTSISGISSVANSSSQLCLGSRSARSGAVAQATSASSAGIVRDQRDGDLVHPLLVLARADQLADLDRRVIEIALGQFVEIVVALARRRADSWPPSCRRPCRPARCRRRAARHVVLEILPELCRSPDSRASAAGRRASAAVQMPLRRSGVQHRQILRFAVVPGERHADQLGPARRRCAVVSVSNENHALLAAVRRRRPRTSRACRPFDNRPVAAGAWRRSSRHGRAAAAARRSRGSRTLRTRRSSRLDIDARATRPTLPIDGDRHVRIEPHQLRGSTGPARGSPIRFSLLALRRRLRPRGQAPLPACRTLSSSSRAIFGPISGTPGTLSTESPTRA